MGFWEKCRKWCFLEVSLVVSQLRHISDIFWHFWHRECTLSLRESEKSVEMAKTVVTVVSKRVVKMDWSKLHFSLKSLPNPTLKWQNGHFCCFSRKSAKIDTFLDTTRHHWFFIDFSCPKPYLIPEGVAKSAKTVKITENSKNHRFLSKCHRETWHLRKCTF